MVINITIFWNMSIESFCDNILFAHIGDIQTDREIDVDTQCCPQPSTRRVCWKGNTVFFVTNRCLMNVVGTVWSCTCECCSDGRMWCERETLIDVVDVCVSDVCVGVQSSRKRTRSSSEDEEDIGTAPPPSKRECCRHVLCRTGHVICLPFDHRLRRTIDWLCGRVWSV